jgi:parallel beta-helix repeat protein
MCLLIGLIITHSIAGINPVLKNRPGIRAGIDKGEMVPARAVTELAKSERASFNGISSATKAGIIRVPEDQSSIQAGIDAAVNGDTILVADNTYYENINFMGKAITVASYMIIDNDTTHRDSTIINGSQPSHPDSGSVVSFTSGEDTTSVIYGFTITGGTGTLYDANHRVGGGIYCSNSGARIAHNKVLYNSVIYDQLCLGGGIGSYSSQNSKYEIIEDNIIESNSLYAQNGSSGGGIFFYMQGGSIIHNKISNNFNSSGANLYAFGGGISIYDNISGRYLVKIVGNTIMNNEATSDWTDGGGIGGGIDVQLSDVLLLSNQITHNKVSGAHPGAAGVRLLNSTGPSMAKDNIISFNSSHNLSGDLWGGGGLVIYGTVGLTIRENQFEGNESAEGSGIAAYSTQGTVISGNAFLNNHCYIGGGVYEEQTVGSIISGNRITRNSADYYGGGIMITECSPDVHNNIIDKNKATFNGGGIYVGDQNSEPQIINNTIVADTAGLYGGGICSNLVSPVVMNTILWANVAPNGSQIYTIGGNTQVVYCDVQGDWPGTGNIDEDPLLEADSLTNASPCIGAGIDVYDFGGGIVCNSPPEDINGRARPYPAGSDPDMGAWESKQGPGGIEPQPVAGIPKSYTLFQNYPNPFNPTTNIGFAIADGGFVSLKVYDITGREVATLVSTNLTMGSYKYTWDAKGVASGVYFYKLEADNIILTRKMILIR